MMMMTDGGMGGVGGGCMYPEGVCVPDNPGLPPCGPATDGWNYGQQENFYPGPGGCHQDLSLPALQGIQGIQYPYPAQAWYCKRREPSPFHFGKFVPHASHPSSIARRNERERNRVKTINSTFAKLRNHLPSGAKNKKLSKVQILRNAITYINQLQQILDAQDAEVEQSDDAHVRIKTEPEDDEEAKCSRVSTMPSLTGSSFLSSDSPVTSPNTLTSSPRSDVVDDAIGDDEESLTELSDWL